MGVQASQVVVAGDWHGNTRWAAHTIGQAAASGCSVILQVGDFGIWPGVGGARYLSDLDAVCAAHRVTIAVTPGNHEDWIAINAWPVENRGDGWGPVKHVTDHIRLLPRGHRFTIAGPDGILRRVVSLGGAPSVDLDFRTPGESWWPEEALTDADVDFVVAGGTADIMLTHDAPEPMVPAVARIVHSANSPWPANALAYAAAGRMKVTRAFNAVRPGLLFHGHYHVRDAADVTAHPPDASPFTCHIESLGTDGLDGNAVIVDITSAAITPIEAAITAPLG